MLDHECLKCVSTIMNLETMLDHEWLKMLSIIMNLEIMLDHEWIKMRVNNNEPWNNAWSWVYRMCVDNNGAENDTVTWPSGMKVNPEETQWTKKPLEQREWAAAHRIR